MNHIITKHPKENKSSLAKKLGVSRGMLYYKHKQPLVDEEIKKEILNVLSHHPAYGHKRIALELKLNRKRILRVMKQFGIKPYRKAKAPRKKDDEGKPPVSYPNLIQSFCPIHPHIIWAGDFTYLLFHGEWYFLSTVMDIFNREIVGWSILNHHRAELILEAFTDAHKKTNIYPTYFHSDQGSEYDSEDYLSELKTKEIQISMSRKSSPWENGFQESFYGKFKVELEDISRFNDVGEFIEAIAHQIYYYNNNRIHTSLKTSPVKFRLNHSTVSRDYMFKEMGT
jgi:transposase InsO family protein